MLMTAARNALGELFDPRLRQVFWKTLGLTIVALMVIWKLLEVLVTSLAIPFLSNWVAAISQPEWSSTVGLFASVVAGIGLAIGVTFLLGPVSAAIAGLFLDDVADHVERQDYPNDSPGTAMPLGESIILSLRFFLIIIAGNLVALLLLLIPGVNLIAFFAINGYLLGREYFEFAARRHHSETMTRQLRARYSGTVILGGFIIAGFMAIPIVNLLTPLFGAALMVHLHKGISAKAAL